MNAIMLAWAGLHSVLAAAWAALAFCWGTAAHLLGCTAGQAAVCGTILLIVLVCCARMILAPAPRPDETPEDAA